jgi:predicted DNA-binding transcriptional regulator YafY
MLEASARLLRMLSLLQARRDWTGPELAERLGVTPRTVRRDVDKLRALGYPVSASTGTNGGYRLGAGAAMPPLQLDDEEAVAVAVGLRSAAGGTVTGIEETSLRALAKLEQVLPSRLRHRVSVLQSMTVPMAGKLATVDADTLTLIAAACRDHQRLRFDYRKYDDIAVRREVEPHRLVHTGRRWYLLGWDLDRDDWRNFRVDRVEPKIPVGPRFVPRDPPSNEEVVAQTSWALSSGRYRHQGRFRMHAPAATVADRVTPETGLVEAIDDRTCILHSGSNSLDALAVHVAVLGFDFDVLGPPELVERARVLGARFTRSVGGTASDEASDP